MPNLNLTWPLWGNCLVLLAHSAQMIDFIQEVQQRHHE